MYRVIIQPDVDKIFKKMEKKNRATLRIINKKLKEILQNPTVYKPLRSPLQNIRRVHIEKSFVLLFSVDEKEKTVTIIDYAHHDDAYKK